MRQVRAERGQILPIVAVALVALLGLCAFSIDIGYAYYAKRQLQAATDASALAGARDLPSGATAMQTAVTYATANSPTNLPLFTFSYQVKCTRTAIVAHRLQLVRSTRTNCSSPAADRPTPGSRGSSASSISTSMRTRMPAARAHRPPSTS